MSQCCGKSGTPEDTGNNKKSIMALGNKLQGDIGESVAAQVAVNELNLVAENFDPPNKGFDSVYRNTSGELVIVEAKLTLAGGKSALGSTNHGRQGSVEWVRYNAELMCDPYSGRYSPDNAKIGKEILRVGAENVHFVVIHTNPETLETSVDHLR